MFKNTSLLVTAAKKEQWPASKKPEFLMCGKSNVGKSSLINALCNRKNLAYTSKEPGRTRMLNFFDTGNNLVLVDAPGYGYYVKKTAKINVFESILKDYFQFRSNCKGLLLLLSAQRGEIDEDDWQVIELSQQFKIPCFIVLTKIDKMSKNQYLNVANKIAKELEIERDDIFMVSSEKRIGIEELCQALEDMANEEK